MFGDRRRLVFKEEARAQLQRGINILTDAVETTLGPSGGNVILERVYNTSIVTKDGVSVARDIFLEHPVENIGAQMIKQAAEKTAEDAGDGPQDLNSKIFTPNGWIRMGDIKKGMDICGTNGTFQKVLGVYEKGQKEKVNVYFSGGGIVTCCINHLWTVTTSNGIKKTIPLSEILLDYTSKNKDETNSYKYFVQTTPVEFNENKEVMTIDPYLLGVLLGDGSLSGTNRSTIEIALGKSKEHIIDKLILPDGVNMRVVWVDKKNYFRVKLTGINNQGKSTIKSALESLNLLGVTSHTKFIPNSYLFSSILSRTKLLQGLIDTDGHINERGLFEFSSINKQLADNFADLCRSLGKQISIREKNRNNAKGYSTNNTFHVEERKGYKYGNKIINIKPTGVLTEMQCIKVSNPDNLYITDDYVVTHNTTSATVLARAIYNRALRLIEQGHKSIEIKQGIDEAVKQLVILLKQHSNPIKSLEDLTNIAIISANGDIELGKTIAEAVYEIGEDGVVLIEESKNEITYSEIIKGTVIERGFISQHFATSGDQEVVLDNPIILVTNTKCTDPADLESFFKYVHENKLSFLLIMEELDKMALGYAIENINKGLLKGAIITPPGVSNMRDFMLEDLAILTGGKVIDRFKNNLLSNVQLAHFGRADKVIVSRKKTIIIGGKGDATKIEDRIKSIEKNIKDSEKNIDTRHKDRLAKMFAGVSTIYVGGITEIERKERKDRVDDAIRATQSALAEGYIIGGGSALYKLSNEINPSNTTLTTTSQLEGFKLVQEAVKTPFRTIISNTGKTVEIIENELINFDKKFNIKSGYNARTGVISKDLVKEGIIDPVKVTRVSLENAASVATLLFTTECVIYYKDEQIESLQMDAGNIR